MADTPIGVFRKNATQALTTSWADLTFETIEQADAGITLPTTTEIQVPKSGIYEVSYFLAYVTETGSDFELLGRLINDTSGVVCHQSHANAAQHSSVMRQGLPHKFKVKLNIGDQISLQARMEGAGATLSLTGSSEAYTSLSIRLIADPQDRIEAQESLTGDATSGDSTTSASPRAFWRAAAAVNGDATTSATPRLKLHTSAAVTGDATVFEMAGLRKRASATVSGSAQATGAGRLRQRASASVSGDATYAEQGGIRFRAAASVTGAATISASARELMHSAAQCYIALVATAGSEIALPGAAPGLSKSFYSTPENMAPAETTSAGVTGDPAYFNRLVVLSSSNFAISPSYSGPAFTLMGPANTGVSPVQLGFKRGDKIRLKGATGTEPNHGRELTLADPYGISVFETLVFPDVNEYDYTVFRRNL
jgi:hypothetical protein